MAAMRSGLQSFVSTNATARLPAPEGTARTAASKLAARDRNVPESTASATWRVAWSASPTESASACSAMKKALIVDSQTPAYVATPTLPYERTMFDSQVLPLVVLPLVVLPLAVLPLRLVVELRSLHPRMREPQMCDARALRVCMEAVRERPTGRRDGGGQTRGRACIVRS